MAIPVRRIPCLVAHHGLSDSATVPYWHYLYREEGLGLKQSDSPLEVVLREAYHHEYLPSGCQSGRCSCQTALVGLAGEIHLADLLALGGPETKVTLRHGTKRLKVIHDRKPSPAEGIHDYVRLSIPMQPHVENYRILLVRSYCPTAEPVANDLRP